ncbi:Choline transporter-like protein, partial [Cynara cardunculus var. scolymus]
SVIGKYPSSDGNGEHGGGNGIIKYNRKCRDVVFLVFFIAFWIAMIVNSSFGFNQGNPLSLWFPFGFLYYMVYDELWLGRLNFGLDYKGNVCGGKHADFDLRQLELKYWVNPNQVYQSGLKNSQVKLSNARTICLLDCPIPSEDSLNWVCDYPEGDLRLSLDDWIDMNYDYFADLTPELRNTSLQLQGPCYPVIFPSVNVYWSCQFIARPSNVSLTHWKQMNGVTIADDMVIDKSIHKSINSRSSVLKRYVADVGKSWPVLIVCGGFLPLFLSLLWLLMIPGWIGNDAISPIIGEHDPYYHVSAREQHHIRAAAFLMTCVMIVAVLSSIAIVAAKVIGEVQALIIFPVIPYVILAIFYMFWLSAALHLFSSGQIVQNDCNTNCCAYDLKAKRVSCDDCCGYSIHYTSHIAASILFHLFGCYWATQFIIACSSTVIAGSVASYYWARGETSTAIPFLPVFSSMKLLMRYSLGSVAIGSLIVSFVESTRFILEAIRRRLKVADILPESWIKRMLFYTSQFCLKCIELTIKSVNRNAYIMMATDLIISNILRIGRVNVIGDVILFLGKLCVSLASALFSFLMLDTHKYKSSHNKITSPLFPVLDAEEHQGTAHYAPPLLIETFDEQNEVQRIGQ